MIAIVFPVASIANHLFIWRTIMQTLDTVSANHKSSSVGTTGGLTKLLKFQRPTLQMEVI